MPKQSDEGGSFRIREQEREPNLRLVQNTIAAFGNWAQQVEAPAIILFPELSITEEAVAWIRTEMLTPRIVPNTLIVLGLEQVSTQRFRALFAESDSREEFAETDFGPNNDLINTAVILIKDQESNVFCYYQPKCTRSDYESTRQYRSNFVYKFAFGRHHLAVSICSDFLLQDETGALVGSVMQDVDKLYNNPGDHRLDLILLIQMNPSPLHRLYHDSIRHLFYNRPHHVQTDNTIICAVNSVDPAAPGKFGKSNVSVMRRGRPPREFKTRLAPEHYAWCSLDADGVHVNEDLHYARWRLRGAGIISFVLDASRRPWLPAGLNSTPVDRVGLHKVREDYQIEAIHPIPEVYELQEVLYGDFPAFINALFLADVLRQQLGSVQGYEHVLSSLFPDRPGKVIRILLLLHNEPINCDHWNMGLLGNAFRYFVVTLRLLFERYDHLRVQDNNLWGEAHRFAILDCRERSLGQILKDLTSRADEITEIDVLLLQRISELYLWDGAPTTLEALNNSISISRSASAEVSAGSVARAPSPQIVDVGSIIDKLNRRCEGPADIRRVLNEILRFA